MIAIYKKGDRSNPANYRSISLTCIACKILEHIISTSIYSHLGNHQILHDAQHGFHKWHSCETQLINAVHDFALALNHRLWEQIDLLVMLKAFDTVSHQKLCHKLDHYSIRGSILKWIKSFLLHRTQRVILNGQLSKVTSVISGVPQGSVLGLLLFIIYINDLPNNVSSSIRL